MSYRCSFPALLSLLVICSFAGAQEPPPPSKDVEPIPAAAAQPVSTAPLLPDGSFIASAQGTMHRQGPGRPWIFTIEPTQEGGGRQDLVILPTRQLEEMELHLSEHPDKNIRFTVSGPVLLYRGKNYLLLQHVEMESEHAERPRATSETPETPVTTETTDTPDVLDTTASSEPTEPTEPEDTQETTEIYVDDFDPIDQGDSIASIVADLQENVGPLKRSVARTEDLSPVPQGVSEGELLVSRRGRMLRDRSGAWVVILDADASGLMDPPMILIPSRKLLSMESWARQGGIGKPILVSGEIFSYRGRHFLLPSAWRIPLERPNLK